MRHGSLKYLVEGAVHGPFPTEEGKMYHYPSLVSFAKNAGFNLRQGRTYYA